MVAGQLLKWVRRSASGVFAAALLSAAGQASAAPVLGAQLYWGGGDRKSVV